MALSNTIKTKFRRVRFISVRCYVGLRRMHMRETAALPCSPSSVGSATRPANSSTHHMPPQPPPIALIARLPLPESAGWMAQKCSPNRSIASALLPLRCPRRLGHAANWTAAQAPQTETVRSAHMCFGAPDLAQREHLDTASSLAPAEKLQRSRRAIAALDTSTASTSYPQQPKKGCYVLARRQHQARARPEEAIRHLEVV